MQEGEYNWFGRSCVCHPIPDKACVAGESNQPSTENIWY